MTAQKLLALVSLLNRFAPQMTEVERLWLQDVLIPDLTPPAAVDVPVAQPEADVPVEKR